MGACTKGTIKIVTELCVTDVEKLLHVFPSSTPLISHSFFLLLLLLFDTIQFSLFCSKWNVAIVLFQDKVIKYLIYVYLERSIVDIVWTDENGQGSQFRNELASWHLQDHSSWSETCEFTGKRHTFNSFLSLTSHNEKVCSSVIISWKNKYNNVRFDFDFNNRLLKIVQ